MRSFLTIARTAVLAALVVVAASSLALSSSLEAFLPLAVAHAILLAFSGVLLWHDRWYWFTVMAGLDVLIGVTALGLQPGSGFIWPWAMLGLGMAAIMTGNHTCRSANVLSAGGPSSRTMEPDFRRTAMRGYWRILTFLGLVWLISLFVLLISLNAAVGALPFWLMAILALLAMVALTFLALTRRSLS